MKFSNFEDMADQEFDEWFSKGLHDYTEATIKEIESSEAYKNGTGLSPEARENLIRRVEELDRGSR